MPKRVKFELDLTERQYHQLRAVLAEDPHDETLNALYLMVAGAEPYIPVRGDVFVPVRLSKLTPTGRQSGTYKFPEQVCLDRSEHFVIGAENATGKTQASTRAAFPVEDFDFELIDAAGIAETDDSGFGVADPPDAENNGAGRLSLVDSPTDHPAV